MATILAHPTLTRDPQKLAAFQEKTGLTALVVFGNGQPQVRLARQHQQPKREYHNPAKRPIRPGEYQYMGDDGDLPPCA